MQGSACGRGVIMSPVSWGGGYCTGEHYVKAWERGYEVGVGTKPSGQPPQDDLNTDPDSPKPLKTPY